MRHCPAALSGTDSAPPDRHRQRAQCGFTLLELLVVVAVIGILASAATVTYRRSVIRARETDTYLEPVGRAGARIFKADFTKTALQDLKQTQSPSVPDLDLVQTGVGQVTGMIRDVRTVAEVIDDMVGQARKLLPGLIDNLS